MIDFHNHILPNIDDGSKSLDISIYMIKSKSVLATPYMLFLITFYVVHQWTEISGWLKELPKKNIQFYK